MTAQIKTNRRAFLQCLGIGVGGLTLGGCSAEPQPGRYTQTDITLLSEQRLQEEKAAGNGPYGKQIYQGYRGLAQLP